MPALGRRLNIFVDAVQEEFLLNRAAEEQIARREKVSVSQYVIGLIDDDMRKRGVKPMTEGGQVRPRLSLPSSRSLGASSK